MLGDRGEGWAESPLSHQRLGWQRRIEKGRGHADAACRHLDAGSNFDQAHPPRAGVTFTKRVCFPAVIEASTVRTASACFNGNRILFEIVAGAFLHRRIGDLLSQRYQQIVGQTVQKHAKAIRHVAVIAQPIRAPFAFQFLIAVLAFAPFTVFVVNTLGQRAARPTAERSTSRHPSRDSRRPAPQKQVSWEENRTPPAKHRVNSCRASKHRRKY